jgi:phosphoglycolate phosphatase-like HAD superfamily hydrolase
VPRLGTIVLDFDGVLAETEPAKDAAFEELFARYAEHREVMLAYHRERHSAPRREKFEHCIYEVLGRPGDTAAVDEMARDFAALVVDRVIAAPEVPGTTDFLQEFSSTLPLYVASVTPEDELGKILAARGIAPFLRAAFGNPPTPKAEAIRAVLAREELKPEEALIVGDSLSDYRAAEETGIGFIGRDSGLPFGGIDVPLLRDMHEVAASVRGLTGAARPA